MTTWISKGILVVTLLLLGGCEAFYEPIEYNDIPASPGSAWEKIPIEVKETAVNPFDASYLSETMTLSELLDMALFNNPSTRASWNASRAAAYAHRASLSSYYPYLEYTGTLVAQSNRGSAYASSGQNIITTNTTTTTTQTFSNYQTNNLSLTYLVLDFGGRRATGEIALQALYSSNWTHNLTMQQVMLSVLNAYTNYIGNKGLVEAFAQDLKDAETALQAAKVMRSSGLATLTDVLLAQSTVETTRTNYLQAQGAENTSLAELLIAVGLPPTASVCIGGLPEKLPVIQISGDICSLLELAKERNPSLGVAIAAIKQQEAELALSYSNSMPIMTANTNWNQVRFIWPKKPSGYNETAFFELQFPIFQGFYT